MSFLFLLIVVLAVVVMTQRTDSNYRQRKFEEDLAALRREVWDLKVKLGLAPKAPAERAAAPKPALEARPPAPARPVAAEPAPIRPAAPRPAPAAAAAAARALPKAPTAAPSAPAAQPPRKPQEPAWELPAIDWEQFTGVKLFAWLGGLALFLAAGFFVKYSIDNDLLPPQLRLAIGAVTGIALVAGSFRFDPKRFSVLRQTLAAGGVGVLFAVVFAATLYYQFLGPWSGFGLLALIALAAFALAAAQDAPATAVLGGLGAWVALAAVGRGGAGLLPLFLYLALVAVSLHQVARRLKRAWLASYATLGTLAALLALHLSQGPDAGPWAIVLVWTGQLALFVGAIWELSWDPQEHPSLGLAALASFASALGAGFSLLGSAGPQAAVIATLSLGLGLAVGFRQRAWASAALKAAAFSWLLVLAWTVSQPAAAAAPLGLLALLAYGVVGGLAPILLLRDAKLGQELRQWLLVYPLALAVLGLSLVLTHPALPLSFWPMDLVLQILGLGLALLAGSVWVGLAVMLGLLVSALAWLLHPMPLDFLVGPFFYLALLGIGLLLVAAVAWALPRLVGLRTRLGLAGPMATAQGPEAGGVALDQAMLLPWLSASPVLGAFIVLGLAFSQVPGQVPHAGLATALSFLALGLGLARQLKHGPLAAVSALSAALCTGAWMALAGPSLALEALSWSLAFWLVLVLAPFALFRPADDWRDAWCAHAVGAAGLALAGMLNARLLWTPTQGAPILLGQALVQLLAVALLVRELKGKAQRANILAFQGGLLLLLVSALPVLLLDRGWMGLVLVFEGLGLVWLNGRVAHPLLPPVGLVFSWWGLGSLIAAYPAMRGAEPEAFGNPAFLSMAVATVLQTLAALQARWQSPAFPLRWRLGLRWTAVGLGFYLLNLGVAEAFQDAPGGSFALGSQGRWAQFAAYTLLWALAGGGLWALLRRRSVMAWTGLGLLGLAVGRAVALPLLYPQWQPSLGPWVNAAWALYVPLLLVLTGLRLWELRRGGGAPAKALLWAMLLVLLVSFKVETTATLRTGQPFSLFMDHSLAHALSQSAGWAVFGLVLLLWPRPLEREFRGFGLLLWMAALARAVYVPLGYAQESIGQTPLLNLSFALLLVLSAVAAWLAKREWPEGQWPLEGAASAGLGGAALLMGFYTLNVGVSQVFQLPGEAFHFGSRGRFGHRLSSSLSWMLYGLGLLGLGIRSNARALRMAGLALVSLTAFKVFLGDLSHLGQLYRVAAFVGLAATLLLVSYLYQRYVAVAAKAKPTKEA